MSSKPQQEVTVERTRLTEPMLAHLEKQFPPIAIPRTELEAGYLLGVQAVIKVLRNGFTAG